MDTRMNYLLFYKDTCVVQLPKSGSNTIYNAHKKTSGYKIYYELDLKFKLTCEKPTTSKELVIHLRDPLDRFWAGVRQDFLDSKSEDLKKYCAKNIKKILSPIQHLSYQHNSTIHTDEKILFRIKRILELTPGWWSKIRLLSANNINNWLYEEWAVNNPTRHNTHAGWLKEEIKNLRSQNIDWDQKVLLLPHIQEEKRLYEYIGCQFREVEFYKKIRSISNKNHTKLI
jgi:hypothetical protein